MASGWKRAMHYLGLVEDFEDDYADLSSDPLGAPLPSEPIAAPRSEPTNVRRLGDPVEEPVPVGMGAAGGGGMAAQSSPVAPTGTVNVLTPGRDEDEDGSGPRTASHVQVTSPTTFNDVEEVGQHFRDGVPVVMNLQGASENVAKRLLDFASGLIYGLDGRIERTGDRIFLLTPADVEIADGERDRLTDRGLLS